jgi:DNA primase
VSFIPSHDAKEQIKQAIDIVDLVGDYLTLRREGRAYKALCPWHDDSRPSLQVNPERQSWKCWVCNVGGDIFNFVMKMENVEFREALAMMADRAGIALPKTRGAAQPSDEKQQLYQAMAWAEEQYHQCLLGASEAEPARSYLAERGITAESVGRFRIGFAPNEWDWLLRRSASAGLRPQVLEKVGLLSRRQDGSGHYDRFRGRLLFSIRNPQKQCVAFGGRVIPGLPVQEQAKYINSPETPLFSKSSMLYGLDVAREAVTQARTAIVMEGYTDCILAHQCGFTHAVAVLGTALGERHLPLLRRFADRVVLMLDGDEAGQRRTNEVLALFVQEQLDLQILTLPDNLDPCDFLVSRGAEAFRAELERCVDALEHKFRTATSGLSAGSGIHQAQQATEEVLAVMAQAPRLQAGAAGAARVKEDQILHRLSRRFGITEQTLRSRLSELRRSTRSRAATTEAAPAVTLSALERAMWESLLQVPERFDEVAAQIGGERLQSEASRIMFRKCEELWERQIAPTFDRLMLEFDEPEMKNLLVELDEQGAARQGADPAASLKEVLGAFGRQQWQQENLATQAAIEERRLDESEELQLFNKMVERGRGRLSGKLTDG